jgi:MinD-like ATPase involved in chromosome partitioning or flagellar assembly
VREPEVALVFTADLWVEELHRHLTDHGGARVRTVLVESEGALEETYDVLLAGHRWPALTRALVADVQARGRAIVGVHDREEAASREHLVALGVDALVESDAGPDAFVRAITSVAGRREERSAARPLVAATRGGPLVTVGGPPGVGRTEIAIELALALGRETSAVLLDADDVAPAVAARLQLPIEPNLRTAIDAVEHGRGELEQCVGTEATSRLRVVTGLPNAHAWAQVRPGEILRVIDRLADDTSVVIADGAGCLEDVSSGATRARFATARAIVGEADVVVAVCDPAPHALARFLAWVVEAHALAPSAHFVVVTNRAPRARFRRGEVYEEITASVPVVDVVFVPSDRRVADAAWNGTTVSRGAFTRAVEGLARRVSVLPRRVSDPVTLPEAS